MTTNADAERVPVKQEHLRLMYATAQERGCQLQPIPNRPPWYEGVCPDSGNRAVFLTSAPLVRGGVPLPRSRNRQERPDPGNQHP